VAQRFFAALTLALLLAAVGPARAADDAAQPAPVWMHLDAHQKGILAPLEADWNNMEPDRRARWIVLAKRYPSLSKEQQERIQSRMRHWAALTPQERAAARERWKKLKGLPPEKRQELMQKWREYDQLPEEHKDQFRSSKPAPK